MAPSGAKSRFAANVEAIETVARLRDEQRPASGEEQRVLARWSSWGAIPQVFEEGREGWEREHAQLRGLLSEEEWSAARRTTINAHYTDAGYVQAIWGALESLGFQGGAVLEPGCGAGTFIGMAPATARMVGVELDPMTAAIAGYLYPDAEVRAESFAETRFPAGYFDAVVGNVPFSDVALHDPEYNPGRYSMHNHFIIKSLEMTRPGGMVAVLTSSFTMDAAAPAARQEMARLGELVGAVRLPSGAHRRAAGTEAVTDLVILRRREAEPRRGDHGEMWEGVTPRLVDGAEEPIRVNNYFDAHPENVLGRFEVGHGMYGEATVRVVADDLEAVPGQLGAALERIAGAARTDGLVLTERDPAQVAEREELVRGPQGAWDGTLVDRDGRLHKVERGFLSDARIGPKVRGEVLALMGLRDQARALLEAEAGGHEEPATLEELRTELRGAYLDYRSAYGPINRYTMRPTGRFEPVLDELTGEPVIDPVTGRPELTDEPIYARYSSTAWQKFRQDPASALVGALEAFDEESQRAEPAGLLVRRTVEPRPVIGHADSAADALALSMDQTGGVDLELVARLLDVDQDTARDQLGELVFEDPAAQRLVPAAEYLSGDVRVKLDQARAAVAADERFAGHVTALEQVIPPTIGMEDIEARLGAVWVSPALHAQFLSEILEDDSVEVDNPLPGRWEVRGRRIGMKAANEWGTERRPATVLAEALMEQAPIIVKDTIDGPEGREVQVINPVETTAAQEKADALQERFTQWVWEDPERADALVTEYNRRFNSLALRDYSQAGEHLTFPGLAASITLRPHQRAAVARMTAEPAVGLFHGVGAGKTLEMIVGATELRRLGLVKKPCVVVPTHMLEQFSREWLQAYPNAAILTASATHLTGEKRRAFIARAAANEWDAIVLTQGAFKAIGLSPQFEERYLQRQIAELEATQQQAEAEDRFTVKQIEHAKLALEQKHQRLTDIPRDPGISFEATGIDYLLVDEAHMYKNLATVSNIPDARIRGSKQATDLHMKLEYLRERYGTRVATLATATPLANSVTEAHVMQRYLRPDLLDAAGVRAFDSWAATFGSTVTDLEMGPAGGYRMKTRFARFQNVPEMLRMWHVPADVKTPEDLDLPVPAIAPRASDGKREVETVVLDPTPEQQAYIEKIADRADRVASRAVEPSVDNMLKISSDGRAAALDLRLLEPGTFPTGPVKLDAVADKILAHWRATRDNEYVDPLTEQPSAVRGGLQLVFCDLGTPGGKGRWSVYEELRSTLIQGGMPPDAVRFIHEARNDAEKARLFAAARGGHVAVLIGSTSKMGVGTNVQDRITAMHHVDCPWRPADLEQRDGRGIRQGNQNPEVELFRYVTEGSFDAYSWQTVARKAAFIAQIQRGRLDTREIEDIGDTALSATEAKALASGDPLVLEKAQADNAYAKLRRQETAHNRAQAMAARALDIASRRVEVLTDEIGALTGAAQRTVDVAGEAFVMRVDGREYTKRIDAARALAEHAQHVAPRVRPGQPGQIVGQIASHDIVVSKASFTAAWSHDAVGKIDVELAGVPRSTSRVPLETLYDPETLGMVRSLENKARAITTNLHAARSELVTAQRAASDAEAQLAKTFPHAAVLARAAQRVRDVDAKMTQTEQREPVPESPAVGRASSPSGGLDPKAQIAARIAAQVQQLAPADDQINPHRHSHSR